MSAYGFAGGETDRNQDDVKWLLEKSRFLCSEINLEVSLCPSIFITVLTDILQKRTCNFASAFQSKALIAVLVAELGGGGKGHRDLLHACVSSGGIPGPVFILAATAVRIVAGILLWVHCTNTCEQVDFCLAEWVTGSRVSVKFDDRARVKYYRHKNGWAEFEEKAPLHIARLKRVTLEKVL